MDEKSQKTIRCLITAGPTREYLDPVRFMSNSSSGKMGYALAEAALRIGWTVDLVSGAVSLSPLKDVTLHQVISAEEMYEVCDNLFDQCDILIMVAAVTDYRPKVKMAKKIKKKGESMMVEFVQGVDIVKTLASRKEKQVVVGFAAETDHIEENAQYKLEKKGLDWIVANDVSCPDIGMEADDNTVMILNSEGERWDFGPEKKGIVAEYILERVRASVEYSTSGSL